eukprot:Gb_34914 [translate_table: standard]
MEEIVDSVCLRFFVERSSNPSLVSASQRYDKSALVKAHYEECIAADESVKKFGAYAISYVHTDSHQPYVAEDSGKMLKPIGLRDLSIGVRHKGRVLRGTLCVKPYKVFALASVLEDEDGNAVRLRIYNTSSNEAEALILYSMGTSVQVREPKLKRALDGCFILHVENPSYIQIEASSSSSSVVPAIQQFWMEGKAKMSVEDFSGAIVTYTKCIRELSGGKAVDALTDGMPSLKLDLAYSNRAEAFLRLKNYEGALRDANLALSIEPGHVKSIFRKGRALRGLQEYKQAILCFEDVISRMEGNVSQEVKRELENERRLSDESMLGNHDFSDVLLGNCGSGNCFDHHEFSDYVGPVELRDGGLFATAEFRLGDLILVSNAIARVELEEDGIFVRSGYGNTSSEQKLVNKIISCAKASKRLVKQLNALAKPDVASEKLKDLIDLFRPNIGWYDSAQIHVDHEDDYAPDVNIVLKHCISSMGSNHHGIGLWALPSFIRHSCIPNSSAKFAGQVMFITAARDIRSGEEISISLKNILQPLRIRHRMLGFTCGCQRCIFEKSLQRELRQISRAYEAIYSEERESLVVFLMMMMDNQANVAGKQANFADEMLRVAVKLERKLKQHAGHLTEEKIRWIRASFALAYLSSYMGGKYNQSISLLPPMDTIAEAMYSTDPTDGICLLIAAKSAKLCGRSFKLDEESGSGCEYVMEMCRALYGKQKPEVYGALMDCMTAHGQLRRELII